MELQGLLSTLNGIAAIVVVLGLCLFFHEAGHFLAAKAFKCKVHDFACGFGPSLIARKYGETTYRLNVIPFGGYVRIAGMEPGAEAEEGGFHSIPRYQSAIILCAGVAMNVVLAVIMFSTVALWSGVPVPDDDSIIIGRVLPDTPAERGGLQPNDKIIAVEGCTHSLTLSEVATGSVAEKAGLRPDMVISSAGSTPVHLPTSLYRLLLKSTDEQVEITALDYSAANLTDQQKIILMPGLEGEEDAECEKALAVLRDAWGVEFGDLDNRTVVGAIQLRPGRPIELTVLRDGTQTDITVVPEAEWARYPMRKRSGTITAPHAQIGRIGVVLEGLRRHVGIAGALKAGVGGSYSAVRMVVGGIWLMITKQVEGGAGGPVAIMAMSAEQARVGWDAVLRWVGIISANLAVINIVPFPPFDGFRVALIGWEAIIRRRIHADNELVMTLAGVIVIVIFFLILTAGDVLNLLRYGTP